MDTCFWASSCCVCGHFIASTATCSSVSRWFFGFAIGYSLVMWLGGGLDDVLRIVVGIVVGEFWPVVLYAGQVHPLSGRRHHGLCPMVVVGPVPSQWASTWALSVCVGRGGHGAGRLLRPRGNNLGRLPPRRAYLIVLTQRPVPRRRGRGSTNPLPLLFPLVLF